MHSRVAEEIREEQRQRMLEMTPDERIELAFRLGEEAIAAYMSVNGTTREETLRVFRRSRRVGRRYSRCMEELDERS